MFSLARPALSIFVGLLVIFFFVRPLFSQIGDLQAEADQYEETVRKVQEFNARLDELVAKRNALSIGDLERLEAFVPHGEIDEVAVLVDLEALADTHGLIFQDVKVGVIGEVDGGDELFEVGGQVEPETVSPGFDASEFLTQDIDFAVVGTYDQFRGFLEDLEQSLVLMEIMKLSFSIGEGELVEYEFKVRLFGIPNEADELTTPSNV
ncbi:hypothetical protein KTR10_00225 [Candidatus Kaiserbacteria bacterium]|nr:hypothetical protein [Candidatus Kaiserbacteria bacterium]